MQIPSLTGEVLGYIGFHDGYRCTSGELELIDLPHGMAEVAEIMATEAYLANDGKIDRIIYPYVDYRLRVSELVRVTEYHSNN